jgi:hypothetical protein
MYSFSSLTGQESGGMGGSDESCRWRSVLSRRVLLRMRRHLSDSCHAVGSDWTVVCNWKEETAVGVCG